MSCRRLFLRDLKWSRGGMVSSPGGPCRVIPCRDAAVCSCLCEPCSRVLGRLTFNEQSLNKKRECVFYGSDSLNFL